MRRTPAEHLKKQIIGTVITRPVNVKLDGKMVTIESETYDVIEDYPNCYLTNTWNENHPLIPIVVPKSTVDKFVPKEGS